MSIDVDIRDVHRFSAAEYRQLVEMGVFDEDARLELIDGLLAEMGPKSRAHENAVSWLAQWLMFSVDPGRFEVRVASSLTIGTSEPEPDLAVIAHGAPRPNHPGTATLVIEVSVSSLERDLVVKPAVYAQARVTEYWVVDLDGCRLVAHRAPGEDGYAERVAVNREGSLTAVALPLPGLVLDQVFYAAAGRVDS